MLVQMLFGDEFIIMVGRLDVHLFIRKQESWCVDLLEKSIIYCETNFVASSWLIIKIKKNVNQSHYRSEVPRGFQEVKVPRLRDKGPGWW